MILNIVGAAIIGNLVTHWFTPIEKPKRWIISKLPNNYIRNAIDTLFHCSKCFTLWFSMIVFKDVFAAVTASFLAYIFNHIIDRIEEWYTT